MSGKQEIGISELAQMLGITPEAVRKYETKGIVQVKRDEGNKYRKYTTWEVFSMLHARRYAQLGFTLGQAAEMLRTSDGNAYIRNIEDIQMKLAEEVAWKRKLIMLLDKKKKERCNIEFQGDRIQIEHLDEMMYFEFANNLCLQKETNRQMREEWLKALPFVSEYVICGREKDSRISAGFAISKKDAELYGLNQLKGMRVVSESMCATCILKGDYDELIMEKQISEAANKIEEKGYRITGAVVAEIFDYAKIDGKYEALHKCYFPIEI